ncbi:hypothetical protein HU200_015814 [Digitaria exilis]|uniref:Uncharacterized protein n=1 Tax=Digitaria exilis TaxID=1010633 RepID=A0A835F8S0_9POAL|nr:hypothetical protein HU200_015814 [Digitaria exilis]
MAIPIMSVPSRHILSSQPPRTFGLGGLYCPRDPSSLLKERWCRRSIAVPVCRAALGYMMDGDQGCSREVQRSFASSLTRAKECDLPTVDGAAGHRGGSASSC